MPGMKQSAFGRARLLWRPWAGLLLFALLAVSRSGLAAETRDAPRRFVLSIGISRFADPFWSPLRFPAKDATDFHAALKDNMEGGWVLQAQPGTSEAVTAADFRAALKRLAVANRNADDTVVIYVSSHGTVGRAFDPQLQRRAVEKVVVTTDTLSESPMETGIPHRELLEAFNALRSRRKVLVLDTCYSGTGKSRLSARMLSLLARQKAPFFAEPEDEVAEGSVILSASAWGEEAQESDALRNGTYTHFLLKGFTQDLNDDGAVSISEAHTYAADQVVRATDGLQHPTARMEIVGRDPIVVSGAFKARKRSPYLYAFEWGTRQLEVFLGGQKVGALSKGGIEVPAGPVRVALVEPRSGQTIVDKVVRFKSGEEYAVEDLIRPRTPNLAALGSSTLTFPQSGLRRHHLPSTRPGAFFRYVREDVVLDSVEGEFGAAIFPSRHDAIRSGNESVTQKTSVYAFDVLASRREDVDILSRRDRAFVTNVRFAAGPTLLHVERTLQGDEFVRPSQTAWLPGAKTRLSIEADIAPWHAHGAWHVETAFVRNAFAHGPRVAVGLGAGLSFGMVW